MLADSDINFSILVEAKAGLCTYTDIVDDQDVNKRREIEKGFMMMTFNRFAYRSCNFTFMVFSRRGIYRIWLYNARIGFLVPMMMVTLSVYMIIGIQLYGKLGVVAG